MPPNRGVAGGRVGAGGERRNAPFCSEFSVSANTQLPCKGQRAWELKRPPRGMTSHSPADRSKWCAPGHGQQPMRGGFKGMEPTPPRAQTPEGVDLGQRHPCPVPRGSQLGCLHIWAHGHRYRTQGPGPEEKCHLPCVCSNHREALLTPKGRLENMSVGSSPIVTGASWESSLLRYLVHGTRTMMPSLGQEEGRVPVP